MGEDKREGQSGCLGIYSGGGGGGILHWYKCLACGYEFGRGLIME